MSEVIKKGARTTSSRPNLVGPKSKPTPKKK